MDELTGRRRFLQLAGTGTALSIAGCNALQSDEPTENGTETETTEGNTTEATTAEETTTSGDGTDADEDSSSGDGETVTVQVQPDQEELQQRQIELQQQLQNGEISQQEAQQQSQEIRQELLTAAIEAFEGRVESEATLTIDDSVDQFGALLVSGNASALIGTLSYEEVGSLLSEGIFEQAQSQAQQQVTPSG